MTNSTERPTLMLTKELPAPPEKVFDAWLDPKKFSTWMGPDKVTCENAQIDPKVGGNFKIQMRTPDGSLHTAQGSYLKITPHTELKMTWKWDMTDSVDTELNIQLEKTPTGTTLTLIHSQLRDQESSDHHKVGWTGSLEKLANYLP